MCISRSVAFLLFFTLLCTGIYAAQPTSKRIIVYGESGPVPDAWNHKSFQGYTRYETVREDGRRVIRAESRQSASALYREIPVNLEKTPWLNWSWRIENVLPATDPQSKGGDDYPARVYVVIRYGIFPWQVRALNYVWANARTERDHWKNPYTDSAVMIPRQAGEAKAGTWQMEQVNVLEDYRRLFGERADTIEGIAIMTDTDDSGGYAVAFYDAIYFSALP